MVNYNDVFKLAVSKGYTRKYSDSVLENSRSQATEDELVYIEMCLIERWLKRSSGYSKLKLEGISKALKLMSDDTKNKEATT